MENQFLEEFLREFLPGLLVCGIFIFIYVRKYLHDSRLKKLKYEWLWVMKKTKVVTIWQRYVKWVRRGSWYYEYWLESEDEIGNIYRSETIENARHGWRGAEEMVKKYDGVVYDLCNKEVAIKQIEDNIQRLEMELGSNPWFFKKRKLKKEMETMVDYLDIAEEWPIAEFLRFNGHKVSVWDNIDVFVNLDKPEEYYFDLDFTKEKQWY